MDLTLTFHSFVFIVGPGRAIFGARPFVQLGVERRAALAVVRHRPRAGATGRMALATAALLHVLVITPGATSLAGPVQHQIEETAFCNSDTDDSAVAPNLPRVPSESPAAQTADNSLKHVLSSEQMSQ